MKLYALAAVAAVSVAAPATAQTVITLTGTPTAMSGTFGNQPISGAFSDSYVFTLGQQSSVGAVLSSIGFTTSTNIDFTSVLLNGNALTINNNQFGFLDLAFTGAPINFGAGPISLIVNGTQFGEGSYSGVVTAVAAVPEPATWALMIGGFGMIGGVMRHRAVQTKVRFNLA